MARKKSTNDLLNQYYRILNENVRRNPTLRKKVEKGRVNKALDAFNRYTANIGKVKSMQENWDSERKFPRRIYMGLAGSNG